jgi:hypothetical protein
MTTPEPTPVPAAIIDQHDAATTVTVLNKLKPALSPILQKLLAFVIGLLTGVGGDFNVSGDYTKSQQGAVLGTTYKFTETVNGTADINATPV